MQTWKLGELISNAESLKSGGDLQACVALYRAWIACNPTDPLIHAAYFNFGVALDGFGDRFGAINAMRETIRLKPDFHLSYINLGRLLEDAGQPLEAVREWRALTSRTASVNGESVKHKLMTLRQLGRIFEAHQLDGPAEEAMRESIEISPAQPEIIHHFLAMRSRQCKWPVVAGWDHVETRTLMAAISPLSLATLLDEPMFQLAQGWKYNRDGIKPPGNPRSLPVHVPKSRDAGRKLRVGYVSSDLRGHAVGFAMTDVFEQHDRDHFEIYAYYCGVSQIDPTRLRLEASADRWVDINEMTDEEAAARIMGDEVDILVDLNGYTKDARTRVFSLRPAPIAVNWFGFPCTMGSPYHHYIIADEQVIPRDSEIYYSEKVVRLACYQPNDRKRPVSSIIPLRAEEGLPEHGAVFCCLNGTQKINSEIFANWMTVLSEVPGSVLWLLGGSEGVDERLRGLAAERGVAPERLIFAARKPNPEHLARYALADLFLDTFPYGAHTTAADALWMGVPVLTRPGESFAARVCASVAHAGGISDLICATSEIYVARAIELGRSKEKIAALKARLIAARGNSLLFDTRRLVRDLEDLYRGMWSDFQDGKNPVPDLDNLDIYHEIAVDLAAEGMLASTPAACRRLYQDRLEARNCISPIRPDRRLYVR
ncbi:MAG: glycosyl transferase [Roseiarcus sp.]